MADEVENENETPDDGDEKLTMGTIRNLIAETVREVVGKTDTDTAARRAGRRALDSRLDREEEIKSAVEKAVEQLKESEDRKAKEKGLRDTVEALKAKVDTPPREYSKLARFMFGADGADK